MCNVHVQDRIYYVTFTDKRRSVLLKMCLAFIYVIVIAKLIIAVSGTCQGDQSM